MEPLKHYFARAWSGGGTVMTNLLDGTRCVEHTGGRVPGASLKQLALEISQLILLPHHLFALRFWCCFVLLEFGVIANEHCHLTNITSTAP